MSPESNFNLKLHELEELIHKSFKERRLTENRDLISELFREIRQLSNDHRLYFKFSNLDIFKDYLKREKDVFLKKYTDSTEKDFYEHESILLVKNSRYGSLIWNEYNTNDDNSEKENLFGLTEKKTVFLYEILEDDLVLQTEISHTKKIKFLNDLIYGSKNFQPLNTEEQSLFDQKVLDFEQSHLHNLQNKNLTEIDFSVEFEELVNESKDKNLFWKFCHVSTYIKTFQNRLQSFIDQYPTDEYDFLKEELNLHFRKYKIKTDANSIIYPDVTEALILTGNNVPDYNCIMLRELIKDSTYKEIFYSEKKKTDFLEEKLRIHDPLFDLDSKESSKTLEKDSNYIKSTIEWDTSKTGSKTDFIRLCKSLIHSGYIKVESQKSLIDQLSRVFNIEITNDGKKEFENIGKASEETNSKIFDSLKLSLKNWRINNEEKKDERK